MNVKNLALTGVFVALLGGVVAQERLSDGTVNGSSAINQNAILELVSRNKGILHTRVALEMTTKASPMQAHVAGLMVYNTETKNDVVPGIYYNDGTKWVLASGGKATSISYNPETYEISFIDINGNPVKLDFRKIVQSNQTITTLVDNKNGTYVYTSESGVQTIINVTADVTNTFEQIINNEKVKNEIISLIKNVGGNVYYDGTKITYLTKEGDTKDISIKEIVSANETLTVLGYNKVKNQLTYQDEKGIANTVDLGTGELRYDGSKNMLTYIDAKGVAKELFLNTTNLRYDTESNALQYTNSKGLTETIGLTALVKSNETLTVLKDNGNGTFTYTNELGIPVTFDANTTKAEVADGIYTIKDGAGNVITRINTNAVGILFNNASNGLVSTNVQQAIEELLSKLNTVDSRKGTLAVSGGIAFAAGSDGSNKLLANTGIEIADGGVVNQKIADGSISTSKVASKNITAEKLTAGVGVADRLALADAAGNVTYTNLVPNSSIVGTDVTRGSDKIVLGGNPEGASLKAFSVDVDETKLSLKANQIKDGAHGQIIVADADGNGKWVIKNDVTTVLKNNGDGTFTYTNELGTPVTFDANTTKAEVVGGIYTIKDGAGNIITRINTNAVGILFNNASNDLVSTNVQQAIEELLSKLNTVDSRKGTLAVSGGIAFAAGSDGSNKLLANTGIEIADGGVVNQKIADGSISTSKVASKNITAEKLTAGVGVADRLALADAAGNVTYTNLVPNSSIVGEDVTRGSEKIVLGGNPEGASLKAFSVDVDESKLSLKANQIKGGAHGQVIVADAEGNGKWVSKNEATTVSNLSEVNRLTTTVNGTSGASVDIINSNVLSIDKNYNLLSTVNGIASTSLDLEAAVKAKQRKVNVSPIENGGIIVVGQNDDSVDDYQVGVKDAGITTSKLALEAVTSEKIMDGTIVPADIAKAGNHEMLVTGADGLPVWKPQNEFIHEIKADNGLSILSNKIQLGGALNKATTITTEKENTLAIAGLEKNAVQNTEKNSEQHLVVLGDDNVLKAVKAAMPKFFYMPSVILPTAADQIKEQQKGVIDFSGDTFSVNLYGLYADQFGMEASATKTANPTRTTKLPVLPSTELDYYITYFDSEVYLEVSISDAGVLTYKISPKADSTGSAYMNIVFAVKP